jgi:outer membrane protein TolC
LFILWISIFLRISRFGFRERHVAHALTGCNEQWLDPKDSLPLVFCVDPLLLLHLYQSFKPRQSDEMDMASTDSAPFDGRRRSMHAAPRDLVKRRIRRFWRRSSFLAAGVTLAGLGCAQLPIPAPQPASETIASLDGRAIKPKPYSTDSTADLATANGSAAAKTSLVLVSAPEKDVPTPAPVTVEVPKSAAPKVLPDAAMPEKPVAMKAADPPTASAPKSAPPGKKLAPIQDAPSPFVSPYASYAPSHSSPAPIVQASAADVTHLPPPRDEPEAAKPTAEQAPKSEPIRMPKPVEPPQPAPPASENLTVLKTVPISLDTVLRLAEEQNSQVGIAREKVQEAYAEECIAKQKWLPDVYVGTAWDRHEGGIQLQEGPLIHSSTGAMFNGLEIDSRYDIREIAYLQVNAQRKVWQQKGELSRITSETLLDAASTYIDLLTARTAEAVARELETKLSLLLEEAKKLASVQESAQADVARVSAEVEGQRQLLAKLRAQGAAASAKLAYLLQLDPAAELPPVDPRLIAVHLIEPSLPTAELVEQALRNGPGVKEMDGLLALIQESIARSKGPGQLLPILEARMAEGAFGAGQGTSRNWDNRWDLGLQARWNLTPWLTRNDRIRANQARMNQAQLQYQDLRGKLTAGVQESRETSLGGREQYTRGQAQISDAERAYDLAEKRRKNVQESASYFEVLMAINALGRARFAYLTSISEYDKAQIRLMVLLGPGACRSAEGHSAASH